MPLALTGTDSAALATGAVLGVRLVSHGRGAVRLVSDDPTVPPDVTFDVLGDARDRTALRGIVRVLAALGRRAEIADLTEAAPSLGGDGTPLALADADDATVDAWLVDHLAEVFHAAGSCSSAVDRAGRVHGVERLWVVDASVLPDLPRAAPALTVMALAHHLASALA